MDEEQNVKIGDFGLATSIVPYGKGTSSDVVPEESVVGTTTYSSPEGGRGEKSDIYSLGVIFFEVFQSLMKTHLPDGVPVQNPHGKISCSAHPAKYIIIPPRFCGIA